VGTSISSGGDSSDVRSGTSETLDKNPHVKFWNDQRGYVRCRLTQDAWQTDYRVLPHVREPGAPIATRASLIVENGDRASRQYARRHLPREEAAGRSSPKPHVSSGWRARRKGCKIRVARNRSVMLRNVPGMLESFGEEAWTDDER